MLYALDNRGRELTLGLETPGGSVAELPLFDGGNYPTSAEATEDGTTILLVSRDRFQAAVIAHPEIAREALRALSIRMRKLMQMVEAHTLHTVRARLAAHLLLVSEGRTAFTLAETNDSIGSQIGTVREVVSRTLRSFKETGLIGLNGRSVTIRDRDALQRAADSED